MMRITSTVRSPIVGICTDAIAQRLDDAGLLRDPDVDAVTADMLKNVAMGYMEIVGYDDKDGPQFRVTGKGRRRVEGLIKE